MTLNNEHQLTTWNIQNGRDSSKFNGCSPLQNRNGLISLRPAIAYLPYTNRLPTHGIVHAGFRGFRALVARKKSRCKLIGNRFVIPHDTIHSTLVLMLKETRYAADAIYGKLTPFLQLCEKMDITYKDGTDMLLGQGVLANNYFTQGQYTLQDIQNVMKESFQY